MKIRLPSAVKVSNAGNERALLPSHEPCPLIPSFSPSGGEGARTATIRIQSLEVFAAHDLRSSRCKEAHTISGKKGQSLLTSAATRLHAFTLLELMVVVVLIGIMTAMIIPEMKGTYEDALLRSSARKLVGIFNLAYSQAVTVSQPHRVRLDRKGGRYVVEKPAREGEGDGGFMPVQNVTGSEGELDTRISIDIRNPADDPELAKDPESPPGSPEEDAQRPTKSDIISFYPDGTADGKEIILRDREGFRLALRINPTTARVRIIEVDRE